MMKPITRFIFLFYLLFVYSNCESITIDLTGEWNYISSDGAHNGTGVVPGDIYSDLYRNKVIENPLFGENHLELKWIAEEDWTYSKTFTILQNLENTAVHLEIDGLDTISTVYINNHKILHSKNQFVSYHLNVTDIVSTGENNITIKFKSPIRYSNKEADKYLQQTGHGLPPICPPEIYHGDCHPNFIRKAQYSYSWDWGPSFPTMGISKNISLNIFKKDSFHDFSVTTTLKNGTWHVDLEMHTFHYGPLMIEYNVKIPELKIHETTIFLLNTYHSLLSQSRNVMTLKIKPEKVDLWWPNGMGTPKLYEIVVSLGGQVKKKKIGFRTVELIQDFVDPQFKKKGRNFYFKINGVPVFLKGSNWIPSSMFLADKENISKMKFLLDSSAEVGMNVLRVWGGGVYENDEFYEYASEKGLLIWQDLMFACALYPTSEEFLENVDTEVHQQIKRLSAYPAILLFSGNNENEAAIRGHWWTVASYSEEQQVKDYIALYSRLAKIVKNQAPSIPFLLSSPSNGIQTEKEGGVAKNPYDVRYGDIHYYNEFTNLWRDDSYLTPRCASEYGIQSFPLQDTMLKWINESEWEYTSTSMFHRQHHPGGIATMLLMIFSHLPVPEQCESKSLADLHRCEYLTSGNFMSRLAYFSQIHQSIALKTQTFHYRRFRNRTTDDGLGNTMCAMYWQLNDVWAAPTWSTIDFEQKWKMGHYEVKRFFANLAVYSFSDEAEFNMNVVVMNDNSYEIQNVTAHLVMYSWANGLDPILTSEVSIGTVKPFSTASYETEVRTPNYNDLSEYLYASVLYDTNQNVIYQDVMLPDMLFEVNFDHFGDVRVEEVRMINETSYEISITTDKISPFTWVDCTQQYLGWFSDNGFHMLDRLKKVSLQLQKPLSLKKEHFTVCNLKNCFH